MQPTHETPRNNAGFRFTVEMTIRPGSQLRKREIQGAAGRAVTERARKYRNETEQDRPRLIAGVAEIVSPQAEAEPNRPAG